MVYLIKTIILLMRQTADFPFARTTTNTTNSVIFTQDKRKVISNLESMLRLEIERREEAERQLADYRRRSLCIQSEFKRLLEKYDNHIAIINGHDSYGQEIWNKLVNEIEKFNSNSEQVLEKRCSEIESMMSRRINEILEKTEMEIKKSKKLSEEEYCQVKQEIKEALKIAKEIEMENESFKKENKELAFKISMLKEEKNLLIGELNQKKMKLKSIMLSIYEENNPSIASNPNSSRPRSKKSTQEYSPIPKFICEPSFREVRSTMENPQFCKRISLSRDRDRNDVILKTDNHVKLCLQRERRKNQELKAIVAKLHHKIKETNALIESSLRDRAGKADPKFFQSLVESIKYKLFVTNGKEHPQVFSSTELSKFMQD